MLSGVTGIFLWNRVVFFFFKEVLLTMKFRNTGGNSRAVVKEMVDCVSRNEDSPLGFPSDSLVYP